MPVINRAEHEREHEKMGVVKKDSAGNIKANVSLRSGTVSSLLALANAGDGELAVATDSDSLVVYKGNPSVGKELNFKAGYRSKVSGIGSGLVAKTVTTNVVSTFDSNLLMPSDATVNKPRYVDLVVGIQMPAAIPWIWLNPTVVVGSGSIVLSLPPSGYYFPVPGSDVATTYFYVTMPNIEVHDIIQGTPKWAIQFYYLNGAAGSNINAQIKYLEQIVYF